MCDDDGNGAAKQSSPSALLIAEHQLQITNLSNENKQMRNALLKLRYLAEDAMFGSWRFKVAAIVDEALGL